MVFGLSRAVEPHECADAVHSAGDCTAKERKVRLLALVSHCSATLARKACHGACVGRTTEICMLDLADASLQLLRVSCIAIVL